MDQQRAMGERELTSRVFILQRPLVHTGFMEELLQVRIDVL